MPTVYFNDITINASKSSIDKIEQELKTATKTATSLNSLNAEGRNDWLGNLLLHIGKSEEEVIYGSTGCRGEIDDVLRNSDNELQLFTSSKGGAYIKCVKDFCDFYVDDAEIIYISEDEFSDHCITNDLKKSGTTYITWFESSDEKFSFKLKNLLEKIDDTDASKAKKEIEKFLHQNFDSFEVAAEALKKYKKFQGENNINISVYKYLPIGDET